MVIIRGPNLLNQCRKWLRYQIYMFICDVATYSYHNFIFGLITYPLKWQWMSTYIPLYNADIITHPGLIIIAV